MSIPKKIHYIWLGNKRKPKTFEAILHGWFKHAVGYEIIEWNELNMTEFRLPKRFYTLMKEKKWAFASDILRFNILEKYGGLYFDIDQVLVKDIPDNFLKHKFFISRYHQVSDYYGFGFIGASAGSETVRQIKNELDLYVGRDVIVNKIGSGVINRLILENPSEVNIFPQEYFYPLSRKDFTSNTHSYHLSNTSWVPWYKKILHKIPGYILIQRFIKKILPKKLVKILFKIDYL